jgi:phage terminase large subunit-like protein
MGGLSRAERNINWIEKYCVVPEGPLHGRLIKLQPWQKDNIRRIYDNPAGTRRAILSFGRKNGKTALAACLLLLHLCGPEARPNSQLFSTAQSRDQAGILYKLAAQIVRQSLNLYKVIVIREARKELVCPELGTVYRALSAEATTAFGLSPVFVVHDELGQVRGPRSELYEAMETATAGQVDPLTLIISTQAPHDADLFSVLIDDAVAGHDDRVVVSLYTAPLDADPFDEDTIKLANPAYGEFQNSVEVLAMAEDARRMPSREAEYRNYILNQRVEANSPFVSAGVWASCGAEVLPIDDVPVYGGLDLSAVNDLTALVLIGRVDEVWQVHPAFWLPREGLTDKARKDRVPYDMWFQDGYLQAAPGKSVDYEFVAAYLQDAFRRYDIRKLAFDRWSFRHLRPWLIKAGFSEPEIDDVFVEFGQGYQSMSPAMRDLEAEILNGRIAHGDHPVLKMCAANAVVKSDPAGSRKLAKDDSTGRIDGMVALLMAIGVAPLSEPAFDAYAMIG